MRLYTIDNLMTHTIFFKATHFQDIFLEKERRELKYMDSRNYFKKIKRHSFEIK